MLAKICEIGDCDRPARARRMCNTHYWRWSTYGDPTHGGPLPNRDTKLCSVDGCTNPVYAKRVCKAHYARLTAYGDPTGEPDRPSTNERFWSKVDKNGPNPRTGVVSGRCWRWTGSAGRYGHGLFWNGEREVPAHRWLYELENGAVDEDLHLDHLCRNPCCVRPDHLEPVAPKVNVQRGDSGKNMADKTHCPQGHPYDDSNTYVNPQGSRECRTCKRERTRQWRARKRESLGYGKRSA